jgi:Ca2+-binding RTX toxin-like protein
VGWYAVLSIPPKGLDGGHWKSARTAQGDTMRNVLLLSIAVLLGTTLAAPGVIDLSAAGTADVSAAGPRRDATGPGIADVVAAMTVDRSITVAAAADRPTCFGKRATLVGSSGDDVLVGTPGPDVIVARAGDDVVRSRGGVDFVCAGPGDDRVSGGPNPGDFGFSQDPPRGDRLAGDEGDDRIFDGGEGYRDLLLGGTGDDRLLTAGGGYAESRALRGGPGADRVTTHPGSFETGLLGGPGPDTLTSRGHNQFLAGEAGADVLTLSGSGDTVVDADPDGDQVRIREAGYVVLLYGPRPVEVDLVTGTARVVGAATGDVITGLNRSTKLPAVVVYGSDGADRISGRDLGEQIYGRSGHDVLAGRGGRDVLSGDGGDDVLDGGDDDDLVDGGRGSDACVNAERVSGCSP